jgi:HEAT repeat-containing protein 5
LVDGDPILRSASSEALGRLASLADNQFLATLMKTLVDLVVNNRDPQARAGCALALGAIYDHVGSLAAGPLLKTTVNILMSLSKDAHPVVHYWALHSLSRVVNAASLAYAPYVSSTLGMLFKVYVLPSHELEGGTLANSNISGDLPAYQAVCQIIDAVITILGPDIQDSTRTRTLILDIVRRFTSEEDEGIRVEAIRCIQHFLMFASEHVDIPELITQFRTHLNSPRRPLKLASIHALYQLVQKDALLISKIGGDRLVEELFAMLDGDPSIEGVCNVISSWMKQTVVYNPSAWMDLCQKIMSRTTASQQATDAATKSRGPVFDDEGESLSVGMASDSASGGQNRPISRWRTQLFALQCLHDICITIARSGRKEQLDAVYARNLSLPVSGLLVSRVPDLIKMAFTASTAYVTEIRLEGLIVLRDVIEVSES